MNTKTHQHFLPICLAACIASGFCGAAVIYTDNPADPTGWSNTATTDFGRGLMHGPFFREEVSMTIPLSGLQDGVQIDFTYYALHSWDGELGYIELNGTRIWEVYTTFQQSVIEAAGGTFVYLGTDHPHRSMGVFEQTELFYYSGESLVVTFGSTLNESIENEAFAFNELVISEIPEQNIGLLCAVAMVACLARGRPRRIPNKSLAASGGNALL